MSKPVILACGEVLWDLFPDGEYFGGAPANFACHASILNGHVSLLSAVGCDRHGDAAIEILNRYNIDTSLVQRTVAWPTGTVGVTLDRLGKPSFQIHSPAAWDHIEWTSELEQNITASDAVYFGTLGQRNDLSRATIHRAIRMAKDHGIVRVLDVNLRSPFYHPSLIRESIQLASILKLSDDELGSVSSACDLSTALTIEQALQALLEQFQLDAVVMTRGADGAVLVTKDAVHHQSGIPVDVVSTVGAGDAFTAAFILGFLERKSPPSLLSHACEIASMVCSYSGAVPSP